MARRHFDNEITRDGIVYGITDTNTLVITNGRNAKCTTVGIPAQINGMPVTEVDEHAFANSKIKNISLPETVTIVGSTAFYSCLNLKRVEFYADCVKIGKNAFAACFKLTDVTGKKIQTVSDYAFWSCKNLVNIEADFTGTVFPRTFGKCKRLLELNFDDGVKIKDDAFYGCMSLKSLYFESLVDAAPSIMKFLEKRQIICNPDCHLAELAYTGTDVILSKVE